MLRYHAFGTEIGWAGIAWGDAGLVGAHLPEADVDLLRWSFTRRFPGMEAADAPEVYGSVIERVKALMAGDKPDLSDAPLDLARVPEFDAKVYEITRAIPAGLTKTYGLVALELGDKHLAREVGAALGRNPWPIIVPCHRVTAAGGKLGGFSARGGAQTKLKLLAIEGALAAEAQPDLFG
jgi:methylated-DNA-[protein]-cysteine S-methyltransferase